ncbi:phenylalanine--tRNA ligase subunit alpha [Phenylobacterium sp. 20VBR1]|uniref:Phenylalanine--tRNA ligase alpha subunit n=1 Tax=Phenylobacterium glaciei TaxID=2803784 RepID=A0A941D480_9CAUL|nr:phenylalanine--tRNA ligase subunit alpha [Phenylobacterium glaciei]MBR7621354.1 phenylalanine--tRNA ligase subunit alpha [Phenylobacterium glaciei]
MTAKLEADLTAAIAAAADLTALEAVRVSALGKSGAISDLLKSLGGMSPDERREQGPLINGLRDRVAAAIAARKATLEAAELDARLASEGVDLSLPAPPRRKGGVHPTMQVMDEMIAIFAEMGFSLAEGPDIETDFNNFTALNFPPKHPAREMHDTFFLPEDENGERKVLRTHTSPVQVRVMNRTNQKPAAPWIASGQEPPIRVIVPGRTFRKDSDQTHTPMFHQIEGLVIDKAIHMGHLKWTLETFLGRFFETPDVVTRFRPHHFPFTEPSAEMDVQCDRSGGEVKIGQGTDWLEILGCGMVHPNVLRNCGLDPDIWQGFAFGCGVDRLGVLKYGMPDLRDMFATDVRWLQHYGFSPFAAPNPATGLS